MSLGLTKDILLKLRPIIFYLFVLFASPSFADNWIKAETDNFVVYSNNNANITEEYINKLEQFRYILSAFHMNAEQRALRPPKLEIYLVKSQGDFKEVWPSVSDRVGGFVSQCTNGIFAFSHYAGSTSEDELSGLHIFFHEYAHLFMFQNTRTAFPRWYVEGFAEFYASTKIRGDQVVIGTASRARYLTLAQNFFRVKYEDILRDGDEVQLGNDEESFFYAQSWLLTHYLLSEPTRRTAFAQYIAARNRGDDPIAAFETRIGVKVDALSSTLNSYMNGNFGATLYRMRNLPNPNPNITQMPASANKLMLWDAAAKGCAPDEYQPALLAKIRVEAAKFPQDAFANAVLARAEIVIGDEEKALPFYTNLTTNEPNNADAHFRLGQVLYLMATHSKLLPNLTEATQFQKARDAFLQANNLDPLNAAALFYYSRMGRLSTGGIDQISIDAAVDAHYLAPSIRPYAVNAAFYSVYGGQLQEAKAILLSLANNPHGGQMEQKYRDAITAISEGKPRAEVLRIISAPRPPSQAK